MVNIKQLIKISTSSNTIDDETSNLQIKAGSYFIHDFIRILEKYIIDYWKESRNKIKDWKLSYDGSNIIFNNIDVNFNIFVKSPDINDCAIFNISGINVTKEFRIYTSLNANFFQITI